MHDLGDNRQSQNTGNANKLLVMLAAVVVVIVSESHVVMWVVMATSTMGMITSPRTTTWSN